MIAEVFNLDYRNENQVEDISDVRIRITRPITNRSSPFGPFENYDDHDPLKM